MSTDVLPTPKVRGLRTPNSALRALKKVIKGREDYVYPRDGGCSYVLHDDGIGPVHGCLIGHLLVGMGVPLEWLARFDSGDLSNGDSTATRAAMVLGIPRDVGRVLRQAQRAQDAGKPWGEAVAEAAAVVASL